MMLMAAQSGEKINVGEMVLHHTADAYSIGIEPFFSFHWSKWPDLHLGPLTLNLTPTKHLIFLVIAAVLVFLTMRAAGRALQRQRAGEQAPRGFAAAVEGLVLWVRNDIAIANIGHGGEKFAPFILTLFFLILYSNVLGLVPHGASPTGNLGVTMPLAIMVLLVMEIAGAIKLGFKGYMGTVFPHYPGISGAPAVILSVAMAPIEVIGKLVKPFALAVRLFGNMTAGHFVVLSLYGIIFLFGYLEGWNYLIGFTTAALVTAIMLLELLVAFLQAYVFALLSSVFIGLMQHEH